MNATQEAKLKMYRAVESYLTANNSIIAANVAFMAAFTRFQEIIGSILSTAQADDVPKKGIAMDKAGMKKKLCDDASILAGLISAYAVTKGNNTLKMEVDYSYSSLMKLRDEMLPPTCRNIHAAGAENLAALADYGVTAAQLSALEDEIDDYAQISPKPRVAISERKALTAALKTLFDQADAALEQRMDKLVQTFKPAHPDFVETYEATRRIVKMPTTTTQLKGTVTAAATAAPIPNANVTAAPSKENSPPLTTTTDAAGDYSFKPIPHGDCQITVTAAGYNDFQTEIEVEMGEINDLDVELEK